MTISSRRSTIFRLVLLAVTFSWPVSFPVVADPQPGDSLDKLIAELRNPEAWSRGAAADFIRGLGSTGAPAVPALIANLHDHAVIYDVHDNFKNHIIYLDGPRYSKTKSKRTPSNSAAAALVAIGKTAVDPLVDFIEKGRYVGTPSVDPTTRPVIAQFPFDRPPFSTLPRTEAAMLASMSDPHAIDAIIPLLKRQNPHLRWVAAWALSYTHERARAATAIETLISMLKDPDEAVRYQVAVALGRCHDPRAVAPLIDALKDQAESVRVAAATALGGLRDLRASSPLVEATKSTSSLVSRAATDALGKLKDDSALPALRQAQRSRP